MMNRLNLGFYSLIDIDQNINKQAQKYRMNLIGSCWSSNVLRNTREWTSLVLTRQANMLGLLFAIDDVW